MRIGELAEHTGISRRLLRRSIYFDDPTPEMAAVLEREHENLTRGIDCMARNRDAIADYLRTVPGAGAATDSPDRVA